MEYVSSIITLTVILGIISACAAGFRLSDGVKAIASLLMVTSILLPLVGSFNKYMTLPDSLMSEAEYSYSDGTQVYIETCKNEMEERLTALLAVSLDTKNVNVTMTLDTSDVSCIEITEVTVCTDGETSKVKELVRQNTGCTNVTVKNYG